jgi:hypothetical protein
MTRPGRYLLPMLVFLVAIGALIYALFPALQRVFQTNQMLNAAILAVLGIGVLHMFGRVLRLAPEIRWAEQRRRSEQGLAIEDPPTMLAPMAAMLGDRARLSLSPVSARALLDSIGARLEESRDISRYLIGLLIFLGLLGTFWGLLDTVASVSDVIKSLTLASGDVTRLFTDLQAGLSAPLSGMGTAFGSSLFGLSGSLVLGFLDLLAGQAQNRFYNELEEWIAGITELGHADFDGGGASPDFLRGIVEQTADRLDNVARALATVEGGRARLDATLLSVGERLAAVAERFAAQEQLTRSLAERQIALEPVLQRLSAPVVAQQTNDTTTRAGLEHLRGIERTLDRLARAVEAPPHVPAAQPPVVERQVPTQLPVPATLDQQSLAHLKGIERALLQLVALSEAERPVAPSAPGAPSGEIDGRALTHLRNLDQTMRQLVALTEARPAAASTARGEPDERALAHLHNLDQAMRQLVTLTEARPAAVSAAPGEPDERALAHLRSLDQTVRQLVAITEARPVPEGGLDDASRRHLASIDAALQRLAALGAVAASASNGGAPPIIDGAALAHLASIEQHLQHIAREAGQLQHRVAQEVRGELRNLAQSLAAMAEEQHSSPEP